MKTKLMYFWAFLFVFTSLVNADSRVYDSFYRNDSNEVGYSEEVSGYRWVEAGDNDNDDIVSIENNTLKMHYFASSPTTDFTTCNLGGVYLDDFVLTVKCKAYSDYYGQHYGVGYRMPNQTAVWKDATGYYVELNRYVTPDTVSLYYGDSKIASADVNIPTSSFAELKVDVSGTRHLIYFEDSLVIDQTHGTAEKGYIGLWGWRSIPFFDDFQLEIDNSFCIFDDFNRVDFNAIDTAHYGLWQWNETGDNANDNLISISENQLAFAQNSNDLSCIVKDYKSADVDMSVAVSADNLQSGAYYGLGYRLSANDNSVKDSNGYYVLCDKDQNNISLWYNTTLLGDADIAIPDGFSRLRVVAKEDSHKVYFEPRSDDDFNRSDSDSIGDIGQYKWNEVLDNTNDDLIQIKNNQLDFHYYRSSPSSASLAVNISDYIAADIDVSVDIDPYNDENKATGMGLQYRLGSVDGKWGDGYRVKLNAKDDEVVLYYGSNVLTSVSYTIGTDPVNLRVIARGFTHDIYIDGDLIISYEDDSVGRSSAGHVGVYAFFSIATFDNFKICGKDASPIFDDFVRTNSNDLGGIDCFEWIEYGENINDDRIRIDNNTIKMHYFESDPNNPSPSLSANVDNYKVTDFNAVIKVKPYSEYYGKSYGFQYRLDTVNSAWASNGYRVKMDVDNDKIALYYGETKLEETSCTLGTDYVELKISVKGNTHKIYVDDTLFLDVVDETKLTSGYLGVWSSYSIIYVDEIQLDSKLIALPPVINIVDSGNLAEGYVGVFASDANCLFDEFSAQSIDSIAPIGDSFPLSLYSCDTAYLMGAEKCFGWNMSQGYNPNPNYLVYHSKNGNNGFMANLDCELGEIRQGYDEEEIAESINACENSPYLQWWAIPEELRRWVPSEYNIVQDYSAWISKYDDSERPAYMYIPGTYIRSSNPDYNSLPYYFPYLDIIPVASYPTLSDYPPAWVRWRAEETRDAIVSESYIIGYDYLNGEKMPLSVLELVDANATDPNENVRTMTPDDAYHDFWQSIVSGAKGIGVWSYGRRRDPLKLYKCWDMYCRAAHELTGTVGLDDVIMNGILAADPTITYNSDVNQTPSFTPLSHETVQYPAIDIAKYTHQGKTYLLTVNSADSSTNATIATGSSASSAKVLFEGRTVSLSSGNLTDDWQKNEVHIYMIE